LTVIRHAQSTLSTRPSGDGPGCLESKIDDRQLFKLVNSCWVAFYEMDPKAKSFTCANGFAWPSYTDAGDDAAEFSATPRLVKSKTVANGPPAG
jgi:hypothetical protein